MTTYYWRNTVKVLILYFSGTGNTKLVAEKFKTAFRRRKFKFVFYGL
jgi:flavodoxin